MAAKSEHVIYLGSLDRPDNLQQIDKLIDMARQYCDWDVIVDLSDITINSNIIGKFIQLREITKKAGRELILCGVDLNVRSVFSVAGLDREFHFTEDRASAMLELEVVRGTERISEQL